MAAGRDTGRWPGSAVQRLKRTSRGTRLAENPLATSAWLRARALPHYVRRGHLLSRRVVQEYLRSEAEPKLQVGSGPFPLEGWLNSDLVSGDVYLNASRPLPLPDNAFSYAFAEHLIEHLPEAAGVDLLRELHRVLRTGGVVRITTPDLAKILSIYEDRNPVIQRDDYARFLDDRTGTGRRHDRAAQILNTVMRMWGHRYIYDEEDLVAKLRDAGFVDVRRYEPGDSPHAALRGIDRHGPEWENRAEAMSVEGTKQL